MAQLSLVHRSSGVAASISQPELSTAGLQRRQRLQLATLTTLVVVGSLIMAALVFVFQIVSVVMLLTWLTMLAIAWRARFGLYVALGLVLLFEAGGPDILMQPGFFLHGGLGSTVGLTGAIASPLELLLLLTFCLWIAQGLVTRRLSIRAGHLGKPMLLFALMLVVGLARGAIAGGDMNIALWESRFLFYTVITFFLAANTIRTLAHVRTLIAVALVAMTLYAFEGAYRRIFLLDTNQLVSLKEFAYSHEVVIFLGALMLLAVAQQVFGAPLWQRLLGPLVIVVAGYTLLATERRAGYIAVIVAFLAYALVLIMAHRKAFILIIVPVLIAGAVYLPVFWNDTGLLGQPARAIRSLSEPDPRDAASNLYRELEKFNVRATIQDNPLLGVGFGREFNFVLALPDLSWWPFWHYEPHHNILWVWLKTGLLGFLAFWVLIGGALARAAHMVKTLKQPESRVFAMFAIAGIISTMVFCYVDLGLTSGRVTVFLGMLLGTLSILDRLDAQPSVSKE